MFGDFDDWADSIFWPAMAKKYGDQELPDTESNLEIEMVTDDRAARSRQDVKQAKVMDSRTLTTDGEPTKRHLEILLPSNTAYKSGDYLAILPLNADFHVHRAMTRFSIPWDAVLSIKGGGSSTIPSDTPLIVKSLLSEYVELCQPATRKARRVCALVKSLLMVLGSRNLYKVRRRSGRQSSLGDEVARLHRGDPQEASQCA